MNKPERAKGQSESSDNNVKVCVRVRPSKPGELVNKRCIAVNAVSNAIVLDTKPECKVFSFDYVADEFVTQGEVFNMVGKPITDSCMSGYNATIFAYGQTGSGKTWTIQGGTSENGDILIEQRGLIPRIFEYLFQLMKEDQTATYTCKCSFLEIYNEQITDLLSPSSTNLSIHENLGRGGYVEGLKEEVVQTAQGAYNVLMAGIANRHVGYTAMNAASSRSHSVLTLSLESRSTSADGLTHVKYSRLNLIDLAGSERQKTTDTVGLRLKEAGNINKSLSALGNVIRALGDVADGKPRHVHYRDSKLTYLLKDSLGGNSKTCIIATVSPADSCFGESLSTLKFAQRAKMIKNTAIVNENSAGSVMALQAEVRRLREELASVSGNVGTMSSATQSGKFDRVMELEVLLSKSMDTNEELQQENSKLEMNINHLKVLCERKDNFVMNTKMVLRFREAQISRLEAGYGHLNDTPHFADEEELRDEVRALRSIVELHPEVTRFAMENLELRDDIAKLDSMADADAQIADFKNHIRYLSAQYSIVLKEKHDLMKGDNDKEKTETIMALRLKLDSQTMDLEEKNEHIAFLSAELERAKSEQICTEQALQQVQKEMVQKERDIQDMMMLADEAFQQKNGSSEKMWMAKIQKLQEDFRESEITHQKALTAQEEATARLRLELAQSQVVNRRLSSHFSFPPEEEEAEEEEAEDTVDMEDFLVSGSTRRASGGFALRDSTQEQQQIREMQVKIDSATEELAQLREERDTLADEIKFLRDREQDQTEVVKQPEIGEILALKTKLDEVMTENKEYSSMMDKYQSQSFQHHVEVDELKSDYEAKLAQLESEIRKCKSLAVEKEAATKQLQTECEELRSAKVELESKYQLEQQVTTQLDRYKELYESTQSQNEELASTRALLCSETEMVGHLQQKINALEQECKQKQEEIESANELDLSNIYERQLKKLQTEHANLQTRMQDMDARTKQDKETAYLFATVQRELEGKLSATTNDVQRLTQETSQLHDNLHAATDEASKWKLEAAQTLERLRESQAALEETINTRKELLQSQTELAHTTSQLGELTTERDTLATERTTLMIARNALTDEIDALNAQVRTVNSEKTELIARVAASENAAETLSAQLKELGQKYTDILGHQNHQQKIKHTQQLKVEIAQLQEENQRLKQKVLEANKHTHNVTNGINMHVSALSPLDKLRDSVSNKENIAHHY